MARLKDSIKVVCNHCVSLVSQLTLANACRTFRAHLSTAILRKMGSFDACGNDTQKMMKMLQWEILPFKLMTVKVFWLSIIHDVLNSSVNLNKWPRLTFSLARRASLSAWRALRTLLNSLFWVTVHPVLKLAVLTSKRASKPYTLHVTSHSY